MASRICIFGDSITHGAFDNKMGGWAERLKVYFWNSGEYDYSVYNLGVSGNTSEDVKNRISDELSARKPEIIIISIGANDSSYRDSLKSNKVKSDSFLNNLQEIFNLAKETTEKIIMIGPCNADEELTAPIPWNTEAFYRNDSIEEYNNIMKNFCRENNLYFISIFGLLNKKDFSDGLHPGPDGHEKIFQAVKDFLIDNNILNS